jgi:sulfite exporter TauE/SafE
VTPMAHHGATLHGIGAQADLLAFVVLGLVGSVSHCVGMCSPFVLIVARRFGVPEGRHAPLAAHFWYSGGRLLTYAGLGAAAGALGGLVEVGGGLIGVQRAAAVAAGLALIGFAVRSLAGRRLNTGAHGAWFARVSSLLRGRMPGHPLTVGLFLGLLPCGLLYSAVAGAVARGGALDGSLALAAFGLGTVPALLGVSLADARLVRHRAALNRCSHVFVLAMGVWFLWTGVGPISPR